MKQIVRIFFLVFLPLLLMLAPAGNNFVSAQENTAVLHFRICKSSVDNDWKDNLKRIDDLRKNLSQNNIKSIKILSAASPDGSFKLNDRLSQERANSTVSLFKRLCPTLADSVFVVETISEDIDGLITYIYNSGESWAEEAVSILRKSGRDPEEALRNIYGGKVWKYLSDNVFPLLRRSEITITYYNNNDIAAVVPVGSSDTSVENGTGDTSPQATLSPASPEHENGRVPTWAIVFMAGLGVTATAFGLLFARERKRNRSLLKQKTEIRDSQKAQFPAVAASPVVAPVDAPVETPVETSVDAPAEPSVEASVETPVAGPVEVPADAPAEPSHLAASPAEISPVEVAPDATTAIAASVATAAVAAAAVAAASAETSPAEASPVETTSAETSPDEASSVETTSAEDTPLNAPIEVAPAEDAPVFVEETLFDTPSAEEEASMAAAPAETSAPEQAQLLNEVNEIIQENISDSGFGVEELAAKIGISRIHLNRRLKSEANTSPSTLLKDARMRLAASLLKQGQLSVAEIGAKSGFSSPSYFATAFKDYFKISPSDFPTAS